MQLDTLPETPAQAMPALENHGGRTGRYACMCLPDKDLNVLKETRISAKLELRLKEKVLVHEHTKHFKSTLAFARAKMLTNASRPRVPSKVFVSKHHHR